MEEWIVMSFLINSGQNGICLGGSKHFANANFMENFPLAVKRN